MASRLTSTRHEASWYAVRLPLLGLLPLGVAGCISPVDNVNGFLAELFGFIALCFIGSILFARWLMGSVMGAVGGLPGTGGVQGGLPGDAVIESIADTGWTITSPGVGPNAPRYKLGLRVTPAGGGAPYQTEVTALIPRIYAPMIVPGAQVGVFIDPTDPMKVGLDLSRFGGAGAGAGAGGNMDFQFDPSGQPSAASLSALVGAVSTGAMPTHSDSAARLLATGVRGTAVITSCQPLGKTVRQINPNAEASHLDDPVWLFTLEVSIAGQAPFPAVFGHRVPVAKAGLIGPGQKLAVAVDMGNKNQDVAIDWDKSPLA